MNFTSQICTTRKQSERLLALGLKKETADIVIRPDNTLIVINENSFIYHNLEKAAQEGYLPAWSLHRLIEMCYKIQYEITTDIYNNEVTVNENLSDISHNIYDNIISIIERLIKEGYFNKEYLME